MALTVGNLTGFLDQMYDPAWAEEWDAPGMVCGDPDAEVAKVLLAVDPAPVVVDEATAWGADLLVCHHPLLLRGVHSVATTTPKGRAVHHLLANGCALFTAHTNADTPPRGVNEALAHAVGLVDPHVIEPSFDAIDKIVTFVPPEAEETVRKAILDAGAGAIGDYVDCTFTTAGIGRFRPITGAEPAIGQVGEPERVEEVRIEAVLPRSRRGLVVEALRAAHPYEEPAFDVLELAGTPSAGVRARGMGRVGRLAAPMPLADFAGSVRAALPGTPRGVLVAGEPDRRVETVAVASGAGDFLLETVLGTDADVYVTSDLRHHRAGEFLEHGGPALIDVPHWAAEWTWLPVLQRALRETVATDTVEIRVSTTCTDPWSFRL